MWSYFYDWPDFGCVCVNITPTYVHTHVHTVRCVNIHYVAFNCSLLAYMWAF